MPANNGGKLYDAAYRRRAARLRAAATADPSTQCWRCGQRAIVGDPWQAGHLIDGELFSALAPEHRSCNARAGRLSLLRQDRKSRSW